MIPLVTLNEGEAEPGALTLSFYDNDGQAVIPTTMAYRIDCDTNDGQEVRDWTAVPSPAAVSTIDITADDTAIISDCNKEETKRLTIIIDSGLDAQFTDEAVYIVKNLRYFTS